MGLGFPNFDLAGGGCLETTFYNIKFPICTLFVLILNILFKKEHSKLSTNYCEA